jgi:CHC2 zinc finger
MSADALISRLDRVKCTKPGNWIACCPAHDDKHPSMTIRELEDGRVLVHCFSGCSVAQILACVELGFDALFPERATDSRAQPQCRLFNAHDVLACLAEEALIVSVASSNLRAGMTLTPGDHERLWLASNRLDEGRRLANGER